LIKEILYIAVFFSLLVIPLNEIMCQKTDSIYHINGNILTGEIKNISYGVVAWKMDGMGTINLEEVKINTIISKKQFEIKMINESIHFGSFAASQKERMVYIVTSDEMILVNIEDIAEVYPLKRNIWLRTSGNFSLGFNYSKSSDVASLVFSGDIDYRKKVSYYNLTFDSNNTYQGDSLSSSTGNIGFAWQRSIKNGWSSQASIGGSQNSELGTKLRGEFNLMGIKDIAYNNWNRLYAGGGLSFNHEIPYGDLASENDLAAIFQVVWKVYKYTHPKVWVDGNLSFLPYLTDDRYRTVFNLNPKISILNDNFTVGLSFYYNYDSSPSENANSTDDHGTNLQFTYSFH